MKEEIKKKVDDRSYELYPENFQQGNGCRGMYGLSDINYYEREGFLEGAKFRDSIAIEEQPGEKDAISFAEWIYQNDIGQNMHGWFIRNPDKAGTFYTTTELYNIYKNANP